MDALGAGRGLGPGFRVPGGVGKLPPRHAGGPGALAVAPPVAPAPVVPAGSAAPPAGVPAALPPAGDAAPAAGAPAGPGPGGGGGGAGRGGGGGEAGGNEPAELKVVYIVL